MVEEKGATPPKGGRMDHKVMRRASEMPVEGPAATDTVAASGGLDLPGRIGHANTPHQHTDRAPGERVPPETAVSVEKIGRERRAEDGNGGWPRKDDTLEERIPGERETDTAMPSEPGIIAGTGYGENIPAEQPDTMSERTRREREREGGGAPGQRGTNRRGGPRGKA